MAIELTPEQQDAVNRQLRWKSTISDHYSVLVEKRLNDSSLTFDWITADLAVIGTFPTKEDKELGHKTELQVINCMANGPAQLRFALDSEVNKARVYRHRSGSIYIAAFCESANVYIFDYNQPKLPPIIIKHHTEAGFGLTWSPNGLLAVGSGDEIHGDVSIWKVNFSRFTATSAYKVKYAGVRNGVNGLCWCGDKLVVGSEDGWLRVFEGDRMVKKYPCNQSSIDNIASSPFSDRLLATVGSDLTIKIWDLAKILATKGKAVRTTPLHTLRGHSGKITCIQFSPHIDGVLASGADNGQTIIWDLRKVGMFNRCSSTHVAIPELIFSHGGHVLAMNDLAWHPTQPRIIGTISEDCRMQVWAPYVLDQSETVVNGCTVPAQNVEIPPLELSDL